MPRAIWQISISNCEVDAGEHELVIEYASANAVTTAVVAERSILVLGTGAPVTGASASHFIMLAAAAVGRIVLVRGKFRHA